MTTVVKYSSTRACSVQTCYSTRMITQLSYTDWICSVLIVKLELCQHRHWSHSYLSLLPPWLGPYPHHGFGRLTRSFFGTDDWRLSQFGRRMSNFVCPFSPSDTFCMAWHAFWVRRQIQSIVNWTSRLVIQIVLTSDVFVCLFTYINLHLRLLALHLRI